MIDKIFKDLNLIGRYTGKKKNRAMLHTMDYKWGSSCHANLKLAPPVK